MNSSSNSTDGRNLWPYPGDGYNVALWHAYDATMAALYLVLLLLTATLVVRSLRSHVPQGKVGASSRVTTVRLRTAFYTMAGLQSLLRAAFFVCAYHWREAPTGDARLKTLSSLVILPDILYFSSYCVLLVYWASVDFTSRGLLKWRQPLRFVILAINVLLYLFVIVGGAVVGTNPVEYRPKLALFFCICVAVFSALVAVSFLVFGIRIYFKFRVLPPGNDIKTRMIIQIWFITACCVLCFAYRSFFVATIPTREYGNVVMAGTYFVLGELIPITLLVAAFQYFPPRWFQSSRKRSGEATTLIEDPDNVSLFSDLPSGEGSYPQTPTYGSTFASPTTTVRQDAAPYLFAPSPLASEKATSAYDDRGQDNDAPR